MRAVAWLPNKNVAEHVSADEVLSLRKRKAAVVWADYPAPTPQDYEYLKSSFGLHSLSLAACQGHHDQRARLTDYGDYLFIVWPVLRDDPATLGLESADLCIYLGSNYVITIHREPLKALDEISRETVDDAEVAIAGSDWLLFRILDSLVDLYFPTIDQLTDKADELEDRMFSSPTKQNITELFEIKHAMLTLRRMAAPQRDVVSILARHESKLVDADTFVYFQDLFDHLARITDSVDTARDVIGGAMDIYLSSLSNRMNDIMKRLTVVATIFMPITFITSLYGMNFRRMPFLESAQGFWLISAAMLIISVAMLVDFRRRGWW